MKHYIYLFTIILSAILVSCNNDSDFEPTVPSDACYDFVTISQIASNNTEFTMRKSEDTPLITYNCSYSFANDSTFYVGERIIIAYERNNGAEPYTSGAITLYGYRLLDNTDQNIVFESKVVTTDWASDPLKTVSLTRTGQYINLQCQLYTMQAEKPQHFILAGDRSTLDDEYPNLYVIYKAKNLGENYYTGYASWDISEVWDLESCRGVNIIIQTPEGRTITTFEKYSSLKPSTL